MTTQPSGQAGQKDNALKATQLNVVMVMLGARSVSAFSSAMVIFVSNADRQVASRQLLTLIMLSTRQAAVPMTLIICSHFVGHAINLRLKPSLRGRVGKKFRTLALSDRPPPHIFTYAKLKV